MQQASRRALGPMHGAARVPVHGPPEPGGGVLPEMCGPARLHLPPSVQPVDCGAGEQPVARGGRPA